VQLFLKKRVAKLLTIMRHRDCLMALRHGVVTAAEHESAIKPLNCNMVVDVGANSGQFALIARHCFPQAKIISFESLSRPCEKFLTLFSDDKKVILHRVAVGAENGSAVIHVSAQDDSSSLLPITPLQETLFPGTKEKATENVQIRSLDAMISQDQITAPALLKMDVQGYELPVLEGCTKLLKRFDYVYVECSFMELYAGQSLADDVITFLRGYGFRFDGIYNLKYDSRGKTVQAEILFKQHPKDSDR